MHSSDHVSGHASGHVNGQSSGTKRKRNSHDDDARLIIKSGGFDDLQDSREDTVFESGLSFDQNLGQHAYTDALKAEKDNTDDVLSVYVHLPFCPSRCLTCDHQTSVSHDHKQIDRYLDALEREVALVTQHLGKQRRLQQLHLGGGTPNYLSEVQLVRLMDIIENHFSLDSQTETSLEANAHRASTSQLALLHGLGFRSLNLEIRDLDPAVQQALGRHQSLPVVRDVLENARDLGFDTVATDLIYGLPMQSAASVQRTIEQLIALNPDRISCYNFSRRADTFQHQRAIDSLQMPSIGDKVAIFSRIVDSLCAAGYQWVGLDCFAKDQDSISKAHREGSLHRNSIGYTAQSGRNVLGFGSSSMSDLSTISVQNHIAIEQWRDSLEQGKLPISAGARVNPTIRARRHALSDLMCNLQLKDKNHALLDGDNEDPALRQLREDGLVEVEGDYLKMTEVGRYTLHQVWGDASPSFRWKNLV